MSKIDKDVEKLRDQLLTRLIPEHWTPAERKAFAKRAGISDETIRTIIRRRNLNADTLLRLLLAKGVDFDAILNFPQKNLSKATLTQGEKSWFKIGSELSEDELVEYSSLVEYVKSRFIGPK